MRDATDSGTSNRDKTPALFYICTSMNNNPSSLGSLLEKDKFNTMLSFSEAVRTCMTKKFFTISGRATRAEYWWFQLFIWGPMFLLILLSGIGGESTLGIGAPLAGIFYIICLIPNFCVGIRRLHDTGHSGYYILWNLIPYVGWIIPFIATLSDSEGDNEYGPAPNQIDCENKENAVLAGQNRDEEMA